MGHAVHQYAVGQQNDLSEGSCLAHLPGGGSEGESCAYIEGWASFFSSIVPYQDPFIYNSGCGRNDIGCLTENNIEVNSNWLDFYLMGEGQNDEATTATILYDLYDNIDHFILGQDDGLSESFANIYETLAWTEDMFSIRWFLDRYMGHVLVGDNDPLWKEKRIELCQMTTDNLIDNSFFVGKCDLYTCGDANGDLTIDNGDVVFLVNYVFKGGDAPVPLDSGDANCDGSVNIGDIVHLINYIFKSGPEPCCPS